MSAFDAYIRLDGSLEGGIACDEHMARHTTYRIGGPAALFVTCAGLADLTLTLETLAEEAVPWTVLGKGSNLLVSDEGYEGAVIVLGREFTGTDFGAFDDCAKGEHPEGVEDGQEVTVTAGAGVVLSRLVQKAYGCGLSGFEFAVGIPGTLGGALRMNAGTGDSSISSIVDSVTVYTPQGGLEKRHAEELSWGYRRSGFARDDVIVEATLKLKTADNMLMRAQMEAARKRRQASQPLDKPSCGSVFRNPPGQRAAELIEGCGLKGTTCGRAQVSEKHANFIVNLGDAKAIDVLELVHLCRERVKETYGTELKPEVRFLGFAH